MAKELRSVAFKDEAQEEKDEDKTAPLKTPMKSFVFDLRWHGAIQELSSFDRLEIYEAICEYARTGEAPEPKRFPDPCKRMALRMIFDQIDDQRKTLEDLMEM